ncbi:hypothetical protein BX600DRAFT_518701 [Xylariales sp. PMI_506]|nr:hypothetical protein BX600DRAFT_518701 [Xylariales sp. PMI_506]
MDSPSSSEKRSLPDDQSAAQAEHRIKKQRIAASQDDAEAPHDAFNTSDMTAAVEELDLPSPETVARDGLRRSIILALQHVGFDSASQEALESLTATTETYLTTFIAHLKHYAESARREHPTPEDFGFMLKKYNIPMSFLKPHLKNPVAKEKLTPEYYDPMPIPPHADYFRTPSTGFLGEELDGRADMQDKAWIPSGLPTFPSKHTYKNTLVETTAPDPQEKRGEAAVDVQKGETALRRINRATKISQQKELKEVAQRNAMSRKRHNNWEAMMVAMISKNGSRNEQQDIADHSMIVDSSGRFARRELPRESRGRIPPSKA